MAKTKSKKKFRKADTDAAPGYLAGQTHDGSLVSRQTIGVRATSGWAAVSLVALGLLTYLWGLGGKFLGDDQAQIVNNVAVRSLGHIGTYFTGGTFYDGQTRLIGSYYRPLMTTLYALIYSFAHLNTLPYHLVQLLLHILCAYLLFLIFRNFFEPIVSLALASLFLVDPVNSQAVYAIASLQEPLFVAFGLTALLVTIKFGLGKIGIVALTALLLLLSLLSKETGILSVAAVLGYTVIANWGKWRKLVPIIAASALALVTYLALRIHAVGLAPNPHLAPIDELGLSPRLMSVPAIILFYLTKVVFPFSLAHLYYWSHSDFSWRYFLLPLVVELAAFGLLIFLGSLLFARRDKRLFALYFFFGAWFVAGLALVLQILPLDETVSETWLYFPLIGVLGLAGVLYEAFKSELSPKWIFALTMVIVVVFAARTALRGPNWNNQLTLDRHDIGISKEDYTSLDGIAQALAQQNDPKGALRYSMRSVSIYQTSTNLNTLGTIYMQEGKYAQAESAYAKGLSYGPLEQLYENKAKLALVYGDVQTNHQFLAHAVSLFPSDGALWDDVAIWDDSHGDNVDAKLAVARAATNGSTKPAYYDAIMAGELIRFEHSQLSQ